MSNVFHKIKSLFCFKKLEKPMKYLLKKCAFILDMKRRNKFITFFVLLFIAVYLCIPSMESIVKKFIHNYGSEITGTDVNLKKFSIKPTSGEGVVKGITIGNPKAYKNKNLFALNEIKVQVNISSITSDTIVIENVLIDQPVINYEMLSLTQNNISDVLANIQSYGATAKASEPEAEAEKDNSSQDTSSKKVIIKNLEVRDGQIEIMAGIGPFKKPITLALPSIKLQNIGQEKQGASIVDTLQIVIEKILKTALNTITESGLKQSAESLKDTGHKVMETGKNALKNLFAE